MSQSEVERFASAVRADKGLQDELKKAAVSNQAIVDFAKSRGYDVDLNEIVSFVEARKATISEEDLDKVAGGKGKSHMQVNTHLSAETEVDTVAVTMSGSRYKRGCGSRMRDYSHLTKFNFELIIINFSVRLNVRDPQTPQAMGFLLLKV